MYYLNAAEVDPTKLFQGDIFEPIPCPYIQETSPMIFRQTDEELLPTPEGELHDAWQRDELILVRARKYKVILLSQTCDIHEERHGNLYLDAQEKYDFQFILYAPLIPVDQLDEYPRLRRNRQRFENQNLEGAFWLPGDPDKGIEESVVYFHLVAAMLKRQENRFLSFDPKRRLTSLRSPYRENIASKFGYMISRVALPSTFAFIDNRPPAPGC